MSEQPPHIKQLIDTLRKKTVNAHGRTPVYPFKSDGCSLSTDAFGVECCIAHDHAYWLGGTEDERKAADRALRDCTRQHSRVYWAIQYIGVRIFGQWWIPASRWRWGYGFKYPDRGLPLNAKDSDTRH